MTTAFAPTVTLFAILTFPITTEPKPKSALSPITGVSFEFPLFPMQLLPCSLQFFSIFALGFTIIEPW